MTHFRLLFPTDYVGAHDLNGKDAVLIIDKVEMEEMTLEGGKKERKPVVWFRKAVKKFVMNKTNAKTVAKLYGTDTKDWIGKAVTLFGTTTKFGHETVECIRVRPTVPKPVAASAPVDEREIAKQAAIERGEA